MRARYFSARPLTADKSVESKSSLQINSRFGYRWENREVVVDCLNLLDRDDNDIEYYYESQLAGEAFPVEDIHLHPTEPRTIRAMVTLFF